MYEGGIRVPFLARGPGISADTVCHVPVVGYDFLPTFYELAGGSEALSDEIDGHSFCGLLGSGPRGDSERVRPPLFFHRPRRLFSAVRLGDHKLMLHWTDEGTISSRELYDLSRDPREEGRERAGQDPATADRLQQMLLDHLDDVRAEKPAPARPKRAQRRS